jgi:hypothetical protein
VHVVLCNVLPGSGYRLHATSRTALHRKLIDRSLGDHREHPGGKQVAQGCRLRAFPNKQLSEHDGHCMQPVRRAFPSSPLDSPILRPHVPKS